MKIKSKLPYGGPYKSIAFMTPEQEKLGPDTLGMVAGHEIFLRRGKPKEVALTLRHELGHMKYPIEHLEEPVGEVDRLLYLLDELCANYYCLKIDPDDKNAMASIMGIKSRAVWEWKLPHWAIDRMDRLARNITGFRSKEVY